ncbi:hypothetical protein FSP39_004807 [Pinctada imbricata]|uniref:POPDC1-3 domain-containing protein n=1 Tax=Pinctada imbricata TaxID=66713 RepID=A0AA88Y928_PINIB|nr:hypothetical protein FSP39_004807 [Pinctada imbricata]
MLLSDPETDKVTRLPVWNKTDNIEPNVTKTVIGCPLWESPHHFLFQVANGVLLIALFSSSGRHGVLFMHTTFVLGFLLLSVWSWVILCAPDYFSWNFSFMIVNAVQALFLMYKIRPVKFCDDLEDVYINLFQPVQVSRQLFKKLVSPDFCTLATLNDGESYASQGISKTDRLGLLISGRMSVYNHNSSLHHIKENEFIDSPEFESGMTGEEKYQVSIVAVCHCRYIFWSRPGLEYLLIKEPHLAAVFNTMLGRDITNKLYSINEKIASSKGSHVDIRLPSLSSIVSTKLDVRKTVAHILDDEAAYNHVTSGIDDVFTDLTEAEINEDATWVHHFTPEAKQQSKQWKHPGSSRSKKAKTVPSAGKVMTSVSGMQKTARRQDAAKVLYALKLQRLVCVFPNPQGGRTGHVLTTHGHPRSHNTSLYGKRDDFNFSITNFPFLSSNIPSSPGYGVFISQLIRYARASTKYTDFVLRARRLSDKLLSQGYVCDRPTSSLRKFYGRYGELVIHYDVPLSRMVDDILS